MFFFLPANQAGPKNAKTVLATSRAASLVRLSSGVLPTNTAGTNTSKRIAARPTKSTAQDPGSTGPEGGDEQHDETNISSPKGPVYFRTENQFERERNPFLLNPCNYNCFFLIDPDASNGIQYFRGL